MIIIKTVIKIILVALSSFVLIHIMSLFGLFVAIAYPFWWIVAPQYTPTFLRKSLYEKKVPQTFGQAVANALVILVFSLFSIGIVFAENKLLFTYGIPSIQKSANFIIPSKGQHKIGEIFPMEIKVEGAETPINAVQADIRFDPDFVEVVEVSTKDSFASIFINKEIDNDIGFTRLSGGIPSAEALVNEGLFGTVYFRGKSAGVVKIDFMPSSMVLANDGRGTNILKDLASASYLILPEKANPESVKDLEAKLISEIEAEKKAKLTFFDDQEEANTARLSSQPPEGQVLGEQKESANLFVRVFGFIKKIDEFVVSFWQSLFFQFAKK